MRRSLPIFVLVLAMCAAIGGAGEPDQAWTFDAAKLRPIWLSTTMDGESVLFVQPGAGARPKAALLFQPTKILAVRSASGEVTYVEGRDYEWQRGTREITLPGGSRIPHRTPQDLRRPAKSQPHRLTHRDGNGEILFGATHEYHDMQTQVTYEHTRDAWSGPLPAFAGAQLPRTVNKLNAKQTLSIALLGDSISTGCNASGWAKVAPFQPPYQDLLARGLEAAYGTKIALKNCAVGGTGTAWGLANIGKVLQADPDLVILAFGMNDAAGLPAARYQANIKGMIDAVRKARPQCEFILVATMLGNKDWTTLHPELFPQYRDTLAQLCGQGVALADMTSIWAELLKYKKDWDMTGNGVNHPNDFGHRVYAQVLCTLLIGIPPDRENVSRSGPLRARQQSRLSARACSCGWQ
ncbi:MAG: SGNH/GDSL hydrolase family protein [Phycisphaerae bacterium]|nr:SGNH/GDSL hydrolase family protein [Phycisphaerae bacterium]